MSLTKEQANKVLKSLVEKNINLNCKFCGNTEINMHLETLSSTLIDNPRTPNVYREGTFINFICPNCGHIESFSLKAFNI